MKGLGIIAALGLCLCIPARGVWSQCIPPAGTYGLSVSPATIPVTACIGASVSFDVIADAGVLPIGGFGFNLAIGAPGSVMTVTPGPALPAGSFSFFSTASEVAGLGVIAPPGPGVVGPILLATITFDVLPVPAPATYPVTFTGGITLPSGFPVVNHIVESTSACDVLVPVLGLAGGVIDASTCPGNFIRGDCNNNGLVGGLVGDIIFMLEFIFTGGSTPTCLDACDANDSGVIDISDAAFLLTWQFLAGPAPPPPTPVPGPLPLVACGPDPSADALTCVLHLCP
jgi:hypothetical protein